MLFLFIMLSMSNNAWVIIIVLLQTVVNVHILFQIWKSISTLNPVHSQCQINLSFINDRHSMIIESFFRKKETAQMYMLPRFYRLILTPEIKLFMEMTTSSYPDFLFLSPLPPRPENKTMSHVYSIILLNIIFLPI